MEGEAVNDGRQIRHNRQIWRGMLIGDFLIVLPLPLALFA
jgi:hypothetical protein